MRTSLFPPVYLMIGDDGALLLPPAPDAPLAIAADDPLVTDTLRAVLSPYPKAPVVLLAAMLAQEIRVDQIPPVGFFDRRKLVQRRLKQAFPHTPLAGLVGVQQDHVAFAGLHPNAPLSFWQKAVEDSHHQISALRLLPLEAATLIKRFLPETKQGWGLLLCHQKASGWRQVVTRRGLPVFTRLTPSLPPDTSPDEIAEVLKRDLRATLDYLPRLGFHEGEEMTALVLADISLQESLRRLSLPTPLTLLTPHQAAVKMSLSAPIGEKDGDTDLFLTALCRHQRSALTLRDEKARALRQDNGLRLFLYGLASVFLFLFLCSCLAKGPALFSLWQTKQKIQDQITVAQKESAALAHPLNMSIDALGQWRQALNRKAFFENPTSTPWPLLGRLASSLKEEARVMRLVWQNETGHEIDENLRVTLRLMKPDQTPDQVIQAFHAVKESWQQKLALTYQIHMESLPFGSLPHETLASSNEKKTTEPVATYLFKKGVP